MMLLQEGQSTGLTAVFEDVSILPPAQKRLAVYSGQLGSALSYNSIEKAREASLSVNQPFSLQMTNTSVVPLDTSQGFMSPNHEVCFPILCWLHTSAIYYFYILLCTFKIFCIKGKIPPL